ncbi:DNRLRE domain-containing protein [Kiritimatiellota bacterium B12222]|nr:DNRLRE domain-containing protein [Kiritimatiellota bacterium B12222]
MKLSHPSKNILFTLSGLLVAFITTESLHAEPIFASQDTYYVRNDKGANFGSNETLLVKYNGTGLQPNRVSIVRFDIGSLPQEVVNSNFSIYLESAEEGDQFKFYGINDLTADDQFNQNTLTFNTSIPGTGVADWTGERNVKLASVTVLETLTVSTSDINSMISFSNSTLDDFINADSNGTVSFAIQRIQNASHVGIFRSTEGALAASAPATAPTLSFSAIPEPSTFLLVSLSVLGFIGGRRRVM